MGRARCRDRGSRRGRGPSPVLGGRVSDVALPEDGARPAPLAHGGASRRLDLARVDGAPAGQKKPRLMAVTELSGCQLGRELAAFLSWIMRARRHCRDHERLPEMSEALITWAAITLMARRLTRRQARPAERPLRRPRLCDARRSLTYASSETGAARGSITTSSERSGSVTPPSRAQPAALPVGSLPEGAPPAGDGTRPPRPRRPSAARHRPSVLRRG